MFLINVRSIVVGFLLTLMPLLYTHTIPYVEDAYTQQAPSELVERVEKSAVLVNFTAPLEVVIPKKAGIDLNPVNKFITQGINPSTKNSFVLINADFFNTLTSAEQDFLVARSINKLQDSTFTKKFVMYNVYPSMFLSILVMALLFIALGYTFIRRYSWWKRLLAAVLIMVVCEISFTDKLWAKFILYVGGCVDNITNLKTVGQLKNKEAAVTALEKIDAVIKHEFKEGEIFWQPYLSTFEKQAQYAKNHATT